MDLKEALAPPPLVAAASTRSPETDLARPRVTRATGLWITGLSLLISLLAAVATSVGIFTANGQHHRTFLTLHGQLVSLQGGGLYANESVSGAAQAIGQDVITLVIAIPLLLAATVLAARGSLRGQLLRAGVLWYFAYTYLLMAFGAAYNPFFLLYVALYSASLAAFMLSWRSLDARQLKNHISRRFARRTIAWLLIGFGLVLALLWLGRIVPSLMAGNPPAGLESYSTLFVQAGDLGLVVPLAILSGALLLKRHPLGYLLAGVLLVHGATLGLALISMTITMARSGIAFAPVEAGFFGILTVVCLAGVVHLLACLPKPSVEVALVPAG
jgi:hypothetical protein